MTKSPLVHLLGTYALVGKIAPLSLSVPLIVSSIFCVVRFPHLLPKNLLYEVALADLYVRDFLSQKFPAFLQQTWWHEIDEYILLGGLPLKNLGHHIQLADLGVRAVLSIAEDFELNQETFMSSPVKTEDWEQKGIDHYKFSSKDMEPLEESLIQKAISIIDSHIDKKEKIYVHCKAGRGRSALIVILHYIKHKRLPPDEALTYVQKKRPQVVLQPSQYRNLYADFRA